MIAGINKPQWLLITASTLIVLVINAVGMWQDFLVYELRGTQLSEIYRSYGCGNPWPNIIPETFGAIVLLLAIAWQAVHMSRKSSFQELPLRLKYASELLIAILVGVVFTVISVSFSSIWVYDFWCGPVLGLLKSSLVSWWSPRFVLPATSMLIFWAIYLSNPQMERAVVAVP